ncbi:TrmH family RNA methyltransferase [Azohydromonas australica]|uniref:TrmH family RNA methyltransferase n=1 Tax=Azohydromonas australica TaxID=364039 RepID=UPI00041EB346|nr:RNA methyltransferase [Azohydromonas australica]
MSEPLHVTSRDNPLLVKLRKLTQDPAAYRKLGLVWLEGDHLCRALLARGQQPAQAVVSESGWLQPALRELAAAAPKAVVLPDALFAGVSALESPARIGFTWVPPVQNEVAAGQAAVVLDRVQDAGNLGSILRSASALGFAQVIALKGSAALWSPKVVRAGMGAHFNLRLVEGVEIEALQALGLPLVATSSHAALAVHEAALPWPCAWVMGHEGQGVREELLQRCGLTVRIAQPGGEESLNVAAAAAICLHESARRRVTAP